MAIHTMVTGIHHTLEITAAAILVIGFQSPAVADPTPAAASTHPHVVVASGANSRGFVVDWSDGGQTWYPSLRVVRHECQVGYTTARETRSCHRAVTREYRWLNRMVRLHPRYPVQS